MRKTTFLFLLCCLCCSVGLKAQLIAPIQGVTKYFIVNKNGMVLTNNNGHATLQRPSQEDGREIFELSTSASGAFNLYNADSDSYLYVAADGYSMAFSQTLPETNADFSLEQQGTTNFVGIKTATGYLGLDATKEGSWIFGNKTVANNGSWYLIPYNSFAPVFGVSYRLVEHSGDLNLVLAAAAGGVDEGSVIYKDGANAPTDPYCSWYFNKAKGTTNEYYVYNKGRGWSIHIGIQNTDDSPKGKCAWNQVGFWHSYPSGWKGNEGRWQIFGSDGVYSYLQCQNTRSFQQCLGAWDYGSGSWAFPSESVLTPTTSYNHAYKFDFVPQPISYTFTMQYGTIVLPFTADVPEGVKAYSFASVVDDHVVLTEVSSMLAYKPYVIMGAQGSTYTFDVAERATESLDAPYDDGLLEGHFVTDSVPANDAIYHYYVLENRANQGGMAFYDAGTTRPVMAPFTAYMKLAAGSATKSAYYFGSTKLPAGKYYQIANVAGRGNIYYDANSRFNFVASTGQTGDSVTTDPKFTFGVIDTLGATYLFCQANKMFIVPATQTNALADSDAQEFGEYWKFTEVPTPVTISYIGNNAYKISAVENNVTKTLSVDNRYFEPVTTYYAQSDEGFPMTFTTVADMPAEDIAAMDDLIYQHTVTGISTTTSTVAGCEYYGINGTRLQKAVRGVNIVKLHFTDGTTKTAKVVVR